MLLATVLHVLGTVLFRMVTLGTSERGGPQYGAKAQAGGQEAVHAVESRRYGPNGRRPFPMVLHRLAKSIRLQSTTLKTAYRIKLF